MLLFGVVGQCMEIPDLVKPPCSVQCIKIVRVTGSKFASFQIARPQIFILKSAGRSAFKKVETKPAAIGSGDPLSFAKKSDEQKQHKVGINHPLQFEVACKILAIDSSQSRSELERSVKGMVNLLHKHD